MIPERAAAAARCAEKLALERGLIDGPILGGEIAKVAPAPSPLAVRGYLALVRARREAGELPRLDVYFPETFTRVERIRVDGVVEARLIDAYRFGLFALDGFAGIECRELSYLDCLAGAWRYEDDLDLVDSGRMCDVLSLFSWFMHLYRELDFNDLAGWDRADQRCRARNAWLDERDGGRGTKAAADVIRAEEKEPGLFD